MFVFWGLIKTKTLAFIARICRWCLLLRLLVIARRHMVNYSGSKKTFSFALFFFFCFLLLFFFSFCFAFCSCCFFFACRKQKRRKEKITHQIVFCLFILSFFSTRRAGNYYFLHMAFSCTLLLFCCFLIQQKTNGIWPQQLYPPVILNSSAVHHLDSGCVSLCWVLFVSFQYNIGERVSSCYFL